MKLLFALAWLGAAGSAVFAADTDAVVTNSLAIPGHASLEIIAPKGWVFASLGRQAPELTVPRTAELTAPADHVKLLITAFWDGFGTGEKKLTAAAFEAGVKDGLQAQFASGSVEKKVVIEKFAGAKAQGWFARFTDAKWVGKTPPAHEYANVAAGWFHCGDVWGNFTLFSNEKDSPGVKKALAVMETLARGPAKR